jgi:hypothetical protein
MRKIALMMAVATLAGCASNPGVVPMGPDTFFVSRQAATGFTGLGSLKVDAMAEAGRYCAKNGRTVEVLRSTESKPPYVLANFPRVELEFRCVNKAP